MSEYLGLLSQTERDAAQIDTLQTQLDLAVRGLRKIAAFDLRATKTDCVVHAQWTLSALQKTQEPA